MAQSTADAHPAARRPAVRVRWSVAACEQTRQWSAVGDDRDDETERADGDDSHPYAGNPPSRGRTAVARPGAERRGRAPAGVEADRRRRDGSLSRGAAGELVGERGPAAERTADHVSAAGASDSAACHPAGG